MSSMLENVINPEVFFQENFSIDEYLSKCTQKSDLITLRKELKNYGSELYATMVDILKTETEGIINLAEYLTNLNSKIDDLSIPLSQLNEEIRTLHYTISDAKEMFKKYLDILESISSEKNHLVLKMRITASAYYINSIISSWHTEQDITILERAVNEYSFQYLYLKELGFEASIIDKDISNTATSLIQLVHVAFLKALNDNDSDTILRCLRMYINLNKQAEAEAFVKEKIIHPVVSRIFTQQNLDAHSQDIELLYQKALIFINKKMDTLFTVIDRNPDTKGFNFIVNSFWIDVDKLLRDNLPHITAPGNPELFKKRFQSTWQFLQQIMYIAKDPELLEKNATFEAHMKRFNLPVYFEIRFQQIATKFESELIADPIESSELYIIKETPSTNSFNLKPSAMLFKNIERCFHEEVFLSHLADQIFKLMMLLLSRYIKWFEDFLNTWKSMDILTFRKLEKFIICALVDYNILKNLIGFTGSDTKYFEKTVFNIVPDELKPALQQILQINGQLLSDLHKKVQQQLVNCKVQQCAVHLQHVASIPRLYRRTNRSIPKEPSHYVTDAVTPIIDFYSNYETVMSKEMALVVDSIIAQLCEQFLTVVEEVLHSVCKTEESLRRLKNRNLSSTDLSLAQTGVDSISDETKIREQIKLDVGNFANRLQRFASVSSENPIQKLLKESGYINS